MSNVSKRALLKLAALSTLGAAALVGCGKKEEAAPAAAAPAAAEPAAAASAPAKPEPLKAAWVYLGPVGDAGWTFAHDQGRKAVEAEFGDKVVTTFVEKVPESADAERVIRDLATQGNKIIFATSFGYMEPMVKVAAEFPDVKFEHATGYKMSANMRVYDAKFYEDAYLAGIVAGKMSKTGTLGFVGSFPIPEVLRNINAYTLGAQSVNPKIKTKVVWISSWFDPPKEGDAAQSLINAGADVLLQNTDSSAVIQTAEKAGKYAFGWDADMSAVAPKAHLASAMVLWGGYYIKSIKEVMDGSWKSERTVWGVKEGQNDLVKVADVVPEETKAKVAEIKAAMKDGSFEVFTGPLMSNDGKEVLAKDTKADQAWKDGVNFYVKGVEGKLPSSK
jgi:basic membrane protein A and related proteins